MKKRAWKGLAIAAAAITLGAGLLFAGCDTQADGTDALSEVYAQAVELGYEGTLEDFIAQLRGEDGKSAAEDVLVTGGGPVANALVACARLGMHASYAGVLSDDASGAFLQENFVRCGVATDLIKRAAGRAFTSYILLSRSSGTRTVVFDRGTLKGPSPEQCRAAVERADILHLDGNFLEGALCAAAYAKERGVKVSLDAGGLYEGIERLLPYVDLLIPSEEFALGITGAATAREAALQLARRYSPERLVITQGSRGGVYLQGGEVMAYRAWPVDCADSNGAGDVFHGAYLAAYADGLDAGACCRFAGAVSALKCTKVGVRAAIPDRAQTLQFMEEHQC